MREEALNAGPANCLVKVETSMNKLSMKRKEEMEYPDKQPETLPRRRFEKKNNILESLAHYLYRR